MNDDKMTDIERRASWSLGVVFLLRMLGMVMVLPVLSTYGMALKSASESLIGLAFGIYGLAQAIFQIPFGLMSDKVGRKPLIIGGLLICVVGSLIAAVTDVIWGIILGRALQGSGAIAAPVMALLLDLTREQNHSKAMAFIGVSFGIAFAIAMVLGPIIAHFIGLHGLFWSITLLTLMGVAVILFLVPPSTSDTLNRESSVIRGSFGNVLFNFQLMKINFSIFCLHTILIFSVIALPPMMVKAGYLPVDQWKVYLVTMLISYVALMPFVLYAELKRCIKQVLLGCVIVLFCTEVVLFFGGMHLWVLFIGMQLFFLAFNVMEVLLPSFISKESPAGYKGTAMGIYLTSQFFGVAFGGMLGGWLLQLQGGFLVCLGGVLLTLLWLIVSATLSEPPYVSRLRIALPASTVVDEHLVLRLQVQPGVVEVLMVPAERNAYIKVDIKQTNRAVLEKIIGA